MSWPTGKTSVEYERTQHDCLHYLLFVLAGGVLFLLWFFQEADALVPATAIAAILCLVGLMFATLTIRDEVDFLAIRYGPLPVFRKRIRDAEITSVEPGRTSILDGWGIHWVPGRGTTYNLWGFDCIKLTLDRKVARMGTDDVDGLMNLVKKRMVMEALARQADFDRQ